MCLKKKSQDSVNENITACCRIVWARSVFFTVPTAYQLQTCGMCVLSDVSCEAMVNYTCPELRDSQSMSNI